MHIYFAISYLFLVVSISIPKSLAQSRTIFDTNILRARGIPSSVATYFQYASRFLPGVNDISLVVNGQLRGTFSVTFSKKGNLCLDDNFFKAAGILIPNKKEVKTIQHNTLSPQLTNIKVTLLPNRHRIELLVPPQLIDNRAAETNYFSGGRAALLNYNLYFTGNHSRNHWSRAFYGYVESGFNFNNWIIRSHDSFSTQKDKLKFQHLSAWVQRTFPDVKTTLQAGQLTLNSPLFSIPSFNGVQISPESALLKQNDDVHVTGITNSAAQVKIRKKNALIYSTLAPAGDFSLNNFPLHKPSQRLEASVIENNSARNNFTIPSSSLDSHFFPAQQSWTFAAGQAIDSRYNNLILKRQNFITGTTTFPIKALHTNITTGIMISQQYASAGLNAETRLWKGTSTYLKLLSTRDMNTGTKGTLAQAEHSMMLGNSLSTSFSTTFYTSGFRHLTDVHQPNIVRSTLQRRIYSANIGWKNKNIGYFSLSLVRSERFDNTSSNYTTLNWNRKIGIVNISLSISPRSENHDDNMYYLNISAPIGKAHTIFSANNSGHYIRTSASASQQLTDTFGYSSGISTTNNQCYDFNGAFNIKPRYTSLYSTYNLHNHNNYDWSMNMHGSIVHDGYGLLFSPYNVRDTFGIVSISGLPNARIQTSAGTVWTNSSGRAVAPSIIPYNRSRIALITQGLPRNVEVQNAIKIAEVSRGSVSRISLKATQCRKILLRVTDSNGKLFPQGLSVLDKKGQYISLTGTESDIYLDATNATNGLFIEDDTGLRCSLKFTLNHKPPKDDEPYETIPAVCYKVTNGKNNTNNTDTCHYKCNNK